MGRVLVVEDDARVREGLCTVIEGWGHEVASAADGRVALTLVASFEPDAVILDLGLPGISGVEVAELIRQIDGYRSFVIALTGSAGPLPRESALRAGCSVFFVKPVDLGELERTLERGIALGARPRAARGVPSARGSRLPTARPTRA
jgi:CheY-like chemotaxis protein